MANIGCPTLELVFTLRGSLDPVADPVPYSTLTWGRVLDDISAVNATLALDCKLPVGLLPLRHEASVYRDGKRVWVGPLLEIDDDASDQPVKIIAKDRLWWATRRRMRRSHVSTGAAVDAGTLFADILDDAYSIDNSMRFTWNVLPCGVSVEREWPVENRAYAYEALTDLASAAVDFTVIDGTLRSDGVQVVTSPLVAITNEMFTTEPGVKLTSDGFVNDAVVMGKAATQETNEAGDSITYAAVVGEARDEPSIVDFGLVDQRFDHSEIGDNNSAYSTALSLVQHSINGVANFSGALLPEFPIGVDEMIPGAAFDAAVSSRRDIRASGRFRLSSFSETSDGGAVSSTITAIPIGTQYAGTA